MVPRGRKRDGIGIDGVDKMICLRTCRVCIALAVSSAIFFSCGRESTKPVGRPVNVLLVTLDTTRADRLGCYGNKQVETPNLDRLAREGTLFEKAFASAPSTLPSHSSIMTGTYPAWHGVHDNAIYMLGADATTLAEELKQRGYQTGAFVSAYVLDTVFGLNQGFDVYDDEMSLPLVKDLPEGLPEVLPADERKWVEQKAKRFQRRADEVTPRAINWLNNLGTRPFFLWVHYFDPHQPYQAPDPWGVRYDPLYQGESLTQDDLEHMVARYDGEIAFMDNWIGHLFQALRETGRWEETLVIVVGDHGESFGEHGLQIWEHNRTIYDEVMHVPLLIRRPDGIGAGSRLPGLVRTIDVVPTVLEWLSLPINGQIQGVSLLPLTEGGGGPPGEVVMEALRGRQLTKVERSLLGLRTDSFKLIFSLSPDDEMTATGQPETEISAQLFDLKKDPGERQSLYGEGGRFAVDLHRRLVLTYQSIRRRVDAKRELDVQGREALRSLGYIQ
jgi:arylsulfatase A-like enzyme